LAAVPSIGRAGSVEGAAPAEAELTRALYEQYANQIFRYCLHQLGSREEAEDAVQSTFLNAFRGIKRGIVPELESAWLFKIAHNVCLSRRRSSWRRGRVESPADFELVEEIAPAPSRRADELIGLQDVLEEMPESQRRAILLREWQGLSYREIAEELELSQAAVETLLFRARRTLASGLERPPERRRAARAADWGNLLTALKSLVVGGSAAAKVAATVAAVSATTVVAAEPIQHFRAQHHPAPAPRAARPSASAPPRRQVTHAVAHVTRAPAPVVHLEPRHVVAATVVRANRHAAKQHVVTTTVAAPAPVHPAAVKLEPVEPVAAAPAARDDKQAAKAERQDAKAAKHVAKHAGHGPPPPPSPHVQQEQPPPAGTNPAGKEKQHGRWARMQQSAAVVTPAPVTTPVAATAVPAPADQVPVDQVQPVAVPDSAKGNGNGKGKGKQE
jgi:RNA polymerase sigma factor (sigma-70 family)